MTARALIFAFTLATVASADAMLAGQADTTKNPLAASASAVAAGRASYDRTCLLCHGPAGQGDRGPALNTNRFVHGSEDGDLFQAIRAGIAGTQMPPFARLSDEEIRQLVSYIRSLSALPKGPRPTPAPVSVSVTTKDGRELRGTRANEDTFTLQFVDAAAGGVDVSDGGRLGP